MYLNGESGTKSEEETRGLTLTWDVFKYFISYFIYIDISRLTLTWDVFKFW